MNFIPKIEYTELGTGTPKSITFDSPPEGDPFDEGYDAKVRENRSISGQQQVSFFHILKSYKVEFLFQSETVKDAVVDFLKNHAYLGGTFDYFPSEDEAEFETFELRRKSNNFPRPIPDAAGTDFEYNMTLEMEKVD